MYSSIRTRFIWKSGFILRERKNQETINLIDYGNHLHKTIYHRTTYHTPKEPHPRRNQIPLVGSRLPNFLTPSTLRTRPFLYGVASSSFLGVENNTLFSSVSFLHKKFVFRFRDVFLDTNKEFIEKQLRWGIHRILESIYKTLDRYKSFSSLWVSQLRVRMFKIHYGSRILRGKNVSMLSSVY